MRKRRLLIGLVMFAIVFFFALTFPANGEDSYQMTNPVLGKGLSIGSSEQEITVNLGAPDRKDPDAAGGYWYVYNKDYRNFLQVWVRDGKVIAVYSNSVNWQHISGLKAGWTQANAEETVRNYSSRPYVLKPFIDKNDGNKVYGFMLYDKSLNEYSLSSGKVGANMQAAVGQAWERQIFDLTNAFRVRMGKAPYIWDDPAAGLARKHSADMAARNYFSHYNPEGESPGDRLNKAGINWSGCAENIAAGTSAIFTVDQWINSSGHRTNMLGPNERLGVGTAFGGIYGFYHTQLFLTTPSGQGGQPGAGSGYDLINSLTGKSIAIGCSEQELLSALGNPDRRDLDYCGRYWYVYNKDYLNYIQCCVDNGIVVQVFTNSPNWQFKSGAKVGMTIAELKQKLTYIQPCDTAIENWGGRHPTHEGYATRGVISKELLVTAYYDANNNYRAAGFTIYGDYSSTKKYELKGYNGPQKDLLLATFEQQLFDLANVERAKNGKKPLVLHDKASQVARAHSEEMFKYYYYSLTNRQKETPEKWLVNAGVGCNGVTGYIARDDYMYYPISVHYDLLNEDPNYRNSVLGNAEAAGFGSAFNPSTSGLYSSYHTAIFFTPQPLAAAQEKTIQEKTTQEKLNKESKGAEEIITNPVLGKTISLGSSEQDVVTSLGTPDRKDPAAVGGYWYIYNQDYSNYLQVLVNNNKAIAIYSNAVNWQHCSGLKNGWTQEKAEETAKAYAGENYVLMPFYDKNYGNKVYGLLVYDKGMSANELSFTLPKGAQETVVGRAWEKQIFDLTNAFRVSYGKEPLVWEDRTAEVARKHSEDMCGNNYFSHINLRGEDPGVRIEKAGLDYVAWAENIAAGLSPIFTVDQWVNSAGHRANMLSSIENLGVGIAFGGGYKVYYTQVFLTPASGGSQAKDKEPPAQQEKPAGKAPASDVISVYVNGQRLNFDVNPTIVNGRTLVPLRAIFEALGATVEWDPAEQKITAQGQDEFGDNVTLVLWVNKTQGMLYGYRGVGGPIELDVPPMIIEGRTMVPTRIIAESLGAEVQWNGELKRIDITRGAAVIKDTPAETGSSPADIVAEFLDCVIGYDLPKASSYFGAAGYDWGIAPEDEPIYKAIFAKISYDKPQIVSEQQEEAVVSVNITSPDMEIIFTGVLDEIIMEYDTKYQDLSGEELDQLVIQLALKGVNDPNCVMVTVATRFYLSRQGDSWQIIGDENLDDALTGNLSQALSE